jgi:methylenetetrahydrofolate dehydrogenase (NADP+)/methenyltetrahydrofolate cyclohydrolase
VLTEARLLEGKTLAFQIQEEIRQRVEAMHHKLMPPPKLVALQAGNNPASEWYINQQSKLTHKIGIRFEKITVPEDQKLLEQKIQELNADAAVHGIFLAMPLPKGLDPDRALLAMDLRKDVEGIHPASLGLLVLRRAKLIPPTAYASLMLIEQAAKLAGKELKGLKAAIAGQSAIVGRPLQLLLGERRVTTFVCNTGTSSADLQRLISESDIVVGCAGQPGLIKGGWIKSGAIVIDVGTTEVEGKLVGDVEFEEARKRSSFITPVPGGVGPLTVTMLMQNLLHAYEWQKEKSV